MKRRILANEKEFCIIEKDGMEIKIRYGYPEGIELFKTIYVKNPLIRSFAFAIQTRKYKKMGLGTKSGDYAPNSRERVCLNDYMLPNRSYFENTEKKLFFEIGLDENFLYIRKGPINGLGHIERYEIGYKEDPKTNENKKNRYIEQIQKEGYIQKFPGWPFNVSVIAEEIAKEKKAVAEGGTRKNDRWLMEKELEREYAVFLKPEEWKKLSEEAKTIEKNTSMPLVELAGWPEGDSELKITNSEGYMEHAPFILSTWDNHYQFHYRRNGHPKPANIEEFLELLGEKYFLAHCYCSGNLELWSYTAAPGDNWNGYIVDKNKICIAGLVSDSTFYLTNKKYAGMLAGRKNRSWKPESETEPEITEIKREKT
ncbi:MAG: hypothetical protein JXJ04_24725 [Spirochaetales bacterium]|nr:hypothetical protein [Spirochaetales bacterium]